MKGSKMKVEERKSLKEINKTLQENIRLLPDEYQQQVQPSMEDLEKFSSEHEQIMKGLPRLLLFMFGMIVLLLAMFGSFAYYSVKLEDTIIEKNNIIRQYQYHDSIYSVLLDKNDSTGYVYYRIRNGKPVTYHELEQQYDSLSARNRHNEDLLESLHQMYPYEVKSRNGGYTVYGPDYKEQLREAHAQIDSLERLCAQYQYENRVQKAKLDLITDRYPIIVRQDTNSVVVKSPTIDSALMLLPYYRDNLKYDADKKVWTIITVKEKVIITEREANKRKKK